MQSAVNALAFPVPDKAWSSLLRRRSDLVLRTASGETTACVPCLQGEKEEAHDATLITRTPRIWDWPCPSSALAG